MSVESNVADLRKGNQAMTDKINDGGSAFPVPELYDYGGRGMTLRDYIAIHASEKDIAFYLPNSIDAGSGTARTYARYRFADYMLAAREVRG
jgi:hypothetical protein